MHPYTRLDQGPDKRRDPTRSILLGFTAFVLTFCVLSLSAHRNAPVSPSAQRASNYLPSLSLSLPLSRLSNDDYSLDYRNSLELSTSPPSVLTHSPTLTFSHIYVLSLPSRQDRRHTMLKLAHALGITIQFIDARDKDEPVFAWIAERVAETRKLRKRIIAQARGIPESRVGGGNDWLTPYPNASDPSTGFPRYPSPRPTSPLALQLATTKSLNWVQHLERVDADGRIEELVPSRPNLDLTKLLRDAREKKSRQLTSGVMSTWYGQTRVMKRVVENRDESALVLEDDVDFEWDLERLWAMVEKKLPKDGWDVTYLGHCWGGESQKPQYLHPLIHPSTGPMCLHAYALTRSGAERILSHLSSPWTAYQTAIDVALPALMHHHLVQSFSIVPPLVIQRKDGPSDLRKGNGSKWRGILRDSTHERILRDEGQWHRGWEDEWDGNNIDPATQLRCGSST